MKDVIEIPIKEYEAMKEAITLLRNTELLQKMNRLIDLMFEEKYGLYLGNDTSDLQSASIQKNWQDQNSSWDHV